MPIGVDTFERDYSIYANNLSETPVLAIVGTATAGPLNKPTLCFSQKDFKEKFGKLSTDCLGTYAAQHFLAQSGRIYYTRVANEDAETATVNIKGTVSGQADEDAVVLETVDPGTAFQGYVVSVSNVTSTGFNLSIKQNAKGAVLYSYKYVSLDEDSDSYIGKVISNSPLRLKTIGSVDAVLEAGDYEITGGDNGSDNVESDIVAALENLVSDTMMIDIIAAPGESSATVIQKGLDVASRRGDSIFLVDPPSGLSYDEVVDWHNGTGDYGEDHSAFNSSFGALYWSWQYIYDEVNKTEVLVPPSVLVAPVYAKNDRLAEPWFAPAGLTRGIISNALRSETVPSTDQVNYMYESPNNVNCIITHDSAGLVVFGQKTLHRVDSALDRVNVRRLVTYIKRFVKNTCQYLAFEPNDYKSWIQFKDLINPKMESLVSNRGLYDYKIISGRDIITDDDIDNYRMPVQILIKPTKTAEYIPIDIVLTSTGVEFNDYALSVSAGV